MSPKAAEAQNVIKANAADRIIFFITRLFFKFTKFKNGRQFRQFLFQEK